MKRKGIPAFLLGLMLAAGMAITGCSSPATEDSTASVEEKRLVLTDDLDREVEIERPQRVAILIGSFADEFADAGGKDKIVAAAHDTWTSFDLGLDESVSDLGEVKNISVETLAAAKPDLVIASAKNESQRNLEETLASLDTPVVYYDVSSFDDYCRVLEQFTEMTGDEDAYEKNVTDQSRIITEIQERYADKTDTPSAVAIRVTGKGSSLLGSNDSVLGEMLQDLNVSNVAGEKTTSDYSMEALIEQQPDLIFFTAQGKDNDTAKEMADEFFSDPKWQQLDAVKSGKVYVMDSKLYNLKPNSKWAESLENLETIVYGE